MNEKYALKGNNSLWFVKGLGFVEMEATRAMQLSQSECECASGLGYEGVRQEIVQKSFAVNYVRPEDLNEDGSVKSNRRNPSVRRFATAKEAYHHGNRFVEIEGHLGFYVTETEDAANASVNWATGKTNPVL